MISLPGYTIIEKLSETTRNAVFRAIHDDDAAPVIIKVSNDILSPRKRALMRHELEIQQMLDHPGIVKPYRIEETVEFAALVLEDFGGLSLKTIVLNKPLSSDEFLKCAVRCAEALEYLHSKEIIHRDIKPSNIIYNPDTGVIKITDFSTAAKLTELNDKALQYNEAIEGTLVYISPEQTGRLNRPVDQRSDLYSLGVSFYEMLTGKTPFNMNDPVEFMYALINKIPEAPHSINPDIPYQLSAIVMKLLAKHADDRYQSASGLLFDLRRCEDEFTEKGTISLFETGKRDVRFRMVVPDEMFGREVELSRISSLFRKVTEGENGVVFVGGNSGVGKSFFVHNFLKKIMKETPCQIGEGKYDLIKSSIPYSAMIEASRMLVKGLYTEDAETIAGWKKVFNDVLGINSGIIADVVPELDVFTENRGSVAHLSAHEKMTLFPVVFQNFIRAFSESGVPLILFLDDLQFADSSSLKLIESIALSPDIRKMCLILSYRSSEDAARRAVIDRLEKMKSGFALFEEITLENLSHDQISQMLCHCFGWEEAKASDFAGLVESKTAGNPLFIRHFLDTAFKEHTIYYNHFDSSWHYNVSRCRNMVVSDNVADLIAFRLTGLPDDALMLLKTASCIGSVFSPDMISHVLERRGDAIHLSFEYLMREQMIIPCFTKMTSSDEKTYFRFAHDQVHEVAHSLLSEHEAAALHYKIGKTMMVPGLDDENLYEAANHLHHALGIIKEEGDMLAAVSLELAAGRKAKSSAAFEQALVYLYDGKTLLEGVSHSSREDLQYAIYHELAECEYMCGHTETAESYFDLLTDAGKDALSKCAVYVSRIVLYANSGKFIENNRKGAEALNILGYELPMPDRIEPVKALTEKKKAEFYELVGTRSIEDLLHYKETDDEAVRMAITLINRMLSSAYVSNPAYLGLLCLTSVTLGLRHGFSPESSYAFMVWGLLLGILSRNYQEGWEYGNLSLKLQERFAEKANRSNVPFVFGNFINHWCRPIKQNISFLWEAYHAGAEIGDFVYASFAANGIARILLSYGHHSLHSVLEQIKPTLIFLRKIKNFPAVERQLLVEHVILNLTGETSHYGSISTERFDEHIHIEKMKAIHYGTGIALYYFYKMMTLYIYEAYAEARTMGSEAMQYLPFIANSMQEADTVFFHTLSLTAQYPFACKTMNEDDLVVIKNNIERMKAWRENAPENFTARLFLLKAEAARISGAVLEAAADYETAAASADENGFTALLAITTERAGFFYSECGFQRLSNCCFRDAYIHYRKWGAYGKIRQMEKNHAHQIPFDIQRLHIRHESGKSDETTSSRSVSISSRAYDSIDMASIIKVYQIMSDEIILPKLMEKIMNLVIQNAGATRGVLIIRRNESFFVESEAVFENGEISCRFISKPLPDYQELPHSVINYVNLSGENVVLGSDQTDTMFMTDPYFDMHAPKSAICLPIREHKRLLAVIYLENRDIRDAFTIERIETLKLLAGQAAVSLKNAMLYEEMEQTKDALARSEEEYRILFENMQDMFYRSDNNGNIILVSASIEKLMGYTVEEAIGKNIAQDLYEHPPERQILIEALKIHGFVEDFEVKLKRKDGSVMHASTNSHFYYDKKGNILGIEGVVRDISERKKTEVELKNTKNFLDGMLDSIHSVLISADREGRVMHWNRAAEKFTGISSGQALSRKIWDIIQVLAGMEERFAEVIRERAPYSEQRNVSDSGDERYFDIFFYPLGPNHVEGAVVRIDEITDAVKKDVQIRQIQKMETIGNLASGLAHDFNNVLGGIKGSLSLLRFSHGKGSYEKMIPYLDVADHSVDRATEMVSQLLTISRRQELVIRPLDLNLLINRVLEICHNTFDKTIEIKSIVPSVQSMMEGDPAQIEQVLLNICINASHAMTIMRPHGEKYGGVMTISLSKFFADEIFLKPYPDISAGNFWMIRISDTGIGIDSSLISKIFDPFFTTKEQGRGTGLGLSMVYTIVRQHKGFIQVWSEPGKGSMFSLFFPVSESEGKTNGVAHQETRLLSGKGKMILVVDDEDIIRNTATAMLEEHDFTVFKASGGEEAVQIFKRHNKEIDLVLLDTAMPKLSGQETFFQLKAIDPEVNVLCTSGFKDDVRVKTILENGAAGFLQKPYSMSDLIKKIQEFI